MSIARTGGGATQGAGRDAIGLGAGMQERGHAAQEMRREYLLADLERTQW
jgi:hypothetical protein